MGDLLQDIRSNLDSKVQQVPQLCCSDVIFHDISDALARRDVRTINNPSDRATNQYTNQQVFSFLPQGGWSTAMFWYAHSGLQNQGIRWTCDIKNIYSFLKIVQQTSLNDTISFLAEFGVVSGYQGVVIVTPLRAMIDKPGRPFSRCSSTCWVTRWKDLVYYGTVVFKKYRKFCRYQVAIIFEKDDKPDGHLFVPAKRGKCKTLLVSYIHRAARACYTDVFVF